MYYDVLRAPWLKSRTTGAKSGGLKLQCIAGASVLVLLIFCLFRCFWVS